MPLTTSTAMLQKAQAEGYAVGAFNAENMEMVLAIVAAAEEAQAPVIIQTTPSTLRYVSHEILAAMEKAAMEAPSTGQPAPNTSKCASFEAVVAGQMFHAMATTAADFASVPVALHLDHGNSVKQAGQALGALYTSIMIDGSKEPLEKNIEITRQVVDLCRPHNIPVEGELGQVGGKEDDVVSETAGYTDPEEAARFVAETEVSSLAIGVGTAHGVYAKTPVLNIELVSKIRQRVAVPLVLHGASGLADDAVVACIKRGICKVNYATELRIAYTNAVRQTLAGDAALFDPKKFGTAAMAAVKQAVTDRMRVCGCIGKA